MSTKLHWVDGQGPGKMALAARPRGGDWLEDELANWRGSGVQAVLSLLTSEEERDLDLDNERRYVEALGMEFLSFPIPDREVPKSEAQLAAILENLDRILMSGKSVVIHCRQGIGRTALVAACLLTSKGLAPETAVRTLSTARGLEVPETFEQRRWIDRYAALAASTK